MLKIKKLLKKNKSGFTLVELMAVVLIIGILVAIAIPMYQNSSNNAKIKTCKANIRTIYSAMEQLKAGATDPTVVVNNASLTSGSTPYLKSIPTCPFGGTYTVSGTAGAPTVNETEHFAGGFESDPAHVVTAVVVPSPVPTT